MQNPPHNWRKSIWQEWRHTNDLEFAENLFELVAEEPVGWGAKCSLIFLSALAGAALGILIVAPITFEWTILQYLALAGGIIGLVKGYLQGLRLTWRNWLNRLESNTPTDNLGRLVVAVLLMGCVGGMVFGPVAWLMMTGLFWAIGGLISWLNRGLAETVTYDHEERRWWFWWRKRPTLVDLQAALDQASGVSADAQEFWSEPLHRLAVSRRKPAPLDKLIDALLSSDWVERFIARHTLVSMGQESVFPLQAIVNNDTTPLRNTAQWLLQNIERSRM